MSTITKTLIATGASSGLGFEAIKILLTKSEPYKFILGCRDIPSTQSAYNSISYDKSKHNITLLPLNLSDLKTTKKFASEALRVLGNDGGKGEGKLDFLMLNAGMIKDAGEKPGPGGSKWCEAFIVNSLSQHYLIHLFKDKLTQSRSRIVVVSSGAVRRAESADLLETQLAAGSGSDFLTVYSASKFTQLLNAHYWRRELKGDCDVVAVSPGLIPTTNLGRHADWKPNPAMMTDAKSIEEGAASILAAFTRSDFPEDPNQIFLTSWGEWWSTDVFALSLDKDLQDKWAPSLQEIERGEGVE